MRTGLDDSSEISVTACVTSGAVVSADKTVVKRSRTEGSLFEKIEIGALGGMVGWVDVGIDQDSGKKVIEIGALDGMVGEADVGIDQDSGKKVLAPGIWLPLVGRSSSKMVSKGRNLQDRHGSALSEHRGQLRIQYFDLFMYYNLISPPFFCRY